MSISVVRNAAVTVAVHNQIGVSKTTSDVATHQFTAALATESAVLSLSDADVKGFFDSNPNQSQIASEAVRLGMNEDQMLQAMQIGGYGGGDSVALKAGIDSYVSDLGNGCTWGASGALTVSKAQVQNVSPTATNAMPATSEILVFYDSHPNSQQVMDRVKLLGLNPAQLVQFEATGAGLNLKDVHADVLEAKYVDAANRLGTDIGGNNSGGWTSYFSPTMGRAITKTEIQDFFSKMPSKSDIFKKASELGLGVGAVHNMMVSVGAATASKVGEGNANHAKLFYELYRGDNGYVMDKSGHIVAGAGLEYVLNDSQTIGTWTPKTVGV
jgi:hypothetical protein